METQTPAATPDPVEHVFPPFGLRIGCGPLELRHVREADVPAVAALVTEGIYDDPDTMPFLTRWAEAPADELPRNTLQFYWSLFAGFRPEAWHMVMLVHHEGELVGVQDLQAEDFTVLRSIETGSWLGRRFQGRGIGTLMRQAVCAFGFDELGAEQMTSGYMVGNERSAGVSRKLGYRFNGRTRLVHPDGDRARTEERVALSPEDFVRPPHPVTVQGADELRRFVGLAATDSRP